MSKKKFFFLFFSCVFILFLYLISGIKTQVSANAVLCTGDDDCKADECCKNQYCTTNCGQGYCRADGKCKIAGYPCCNGKYADTTCTSGYRCGTAPTSTPVPTNTPIPTPTICPIGICSSTHNNCVSGTTGWTASYADRWEWWCNGCNAAHPGSGTGTGDILCSEAIPTPTPTSTPVPTIIPTITPTVTPTPTSVPTVTLTPTPTRTPTPTPTRTPTPTPTRTPTPTPTTAPGAWIKLKDASFISKNSLINNIPASPLAYDGDDSPVNTYFIRGTAGLVAAPGISLSSGTAGSPEYKVLYSPNPYSLTPGSFLSYIKARKLHTVITNPNLSEITSSGIYIYQGVSPLVIDVSNSSVFNGKNIVLLSESVINITVNFNPTGSAAIIANQINFGNTVTQAEGIFIGNVINSGTAAFGLKVVGNLIAQTSFTDSRTQPNLNKPAIFIVFDSQKYVDLLPYLSTANYDWRQIQ